MKVRLLKKLRKEFIILERNGKYKVYCMTECSGGIHNQTNWNEEFEFISLIRREWILTKARRNHDEYKHVLK